MDLLTALLALGSLLCAAGIKLAISELQDWMPAIARRIVDCAVAQLPSGGQCRYREEWYADLDEFLGKLSKLLRAISLYCGAFQIARLKLNETSNSKYEELVVHSNRPASELHLVACDRFSISINPNDLSATVVDHSPTEGDEARDILNFVLDGLATADLVRSYNRDVDWNEFLRTVAVYVIRTSNLNFDRTAAATPASPPPGPRSRCRAT